MFDNLVFYAGKYAFSKIRESGLNPDDIKIIAGAAGGPKWLILGHLDRMLFSSWFKNRKAPLFMIGSSSGAWRFTCDAQNDPVAAVNRFEAAYIDQRYSTVPKPEEVDRVAETILEQVIGTHGAEEILTHPFIRLNIMAVRCRGLLAYEGNRLMLGMILAALCNLISRKYLGIFFERALFYDSREKPPFFGMDLFPIDRIALTRKNIGHALMASAAIPLVMSGITNIPGAPFGTYRDGGVIDYHMDIPFKIDNSLVLFPHYTDHVIPGWLDKKLSWRKPSALNMSHVLLVAPSKEFCSRLPYGRIPDRDDFMRFMGRDNERISFWNRAVDLSRTLADEFAEAVHTGRIREKVQPMPFLK